MLHYYYFQVFKLNSLKCSEGHYLNTWTERRMSILFFKEEKQCQRTLKCAVVRLSDIFRHFEEKVLKDNIKDAWIFVLGHYLFLEAHSFL